MAGAKRADADDLRGALGGRVILLAASHQIVFHRFDLLGDLARHNEQGLHHRQTIEGHVHGFVERFAGGMAPATGPGS